MPYTTEADLVAECGGLTELNELIPRTAPTGTVDVRGYWIAKAIEQGDDKVNSYLAPRYATPLQNPRPHIRQLAAAEAIYWLWTKKGNVPESVIGAAELRLLELQGLRDGKSWPNDEPLPETNGEQSMVVINRRPWSHRRLGRIL